LADRNESLAKGVHAMSDSSTQYTELDAESKSTQYTELDAESKLFVGRWNRLISTTNWTKGQIILEWREALVSAGVPQQEHSDEAWAARVGGVTGQHVGRLRRVASRFATVYEQYDGLYWSHFQAVLDWDDAEMWLEGAAQNGWSVAGMKTNRQETLGIVEEENSTPQDTVTEIREDLVPSLPATISATVSETQAEVRSLTESAIGDEDPADQPVDSIAEPADEVEMATPDRAVNRVRPFEELGDLPADIVEAFESFKLAILRHRNQQWQEIAMEDVLGTLDSLKELALAP